MHYHLAVITVIKIHKLASYVHMGAASLLKDGSVAKPCKFLIVNLTHNTLQMEHQYLQDTDPLQIITHSISAYKFIARTL